MKTDSIDSTEPTTASSSSIERWEKACNQLMVLFVVMALACGLGLYQTGHLELPMASSVQTKPPPLDRGGSIGPLDKALVNKFNQVIGTLLRLVERAA